MEENVEFYVGMPVRIREFPEPGGIVCWDPGMNKFCGIEAVITYIDFDETFHLDVDGGDFWWDYQKVSQYAQDLTRKSTLTPTTSYWKTCYPIFV